MQCLTQMRRISDSDVLSEPVGSRRRKIPRGSARSGQIVDFLQDCCVTVWINDIGLSRQSVPYLLITLSFEVKGPYQVTSESQTRARVSTHLLSGE